MKGIVIGIIILFGVFTVVNLYPQDRPQAKFEFYPNLMEFQDGKNAVGVGFGFVEVSHDEKQTWNLFPMRIYLQTENGRFFLAMNGLSFLLRNGINYGEPVNVTGVQKGDVISMGGPVTVFGRVEGDVWVFNADVHVVGGGVVMGNVMAIGGNVIADYGSYISGNKESLPALQIPFLGFLIAPQAVNLLPIIFQLFHILLFIMILFLFSFFGKTRLAGLADSAFTNWKGSVIFLLLSLVFIPILVLLLAASAIGLMFVPIILLVLAAMAYSGYMAIAISVGRLLTKGDESTGGLFLAGLLGYLILNSPYILGMLVPFIPGEFFITAGGVLKVVGAAVTWIAFTYAVGMGIAHLKERS